MCDKYVARFRIGRHSSEIIDDSYASILARLAKARVNSFEVFHHGASDSVDAIDRTGDKLVAFCNDSMWSLAATFDPRLKSREMQMRVRFEKIFAAA